MKFTMEFHKLCLYGDVKLFKLLSSSIDNESIITNKSSMSYCISKVLTLIDSFLIYLLNMVLKIFILVLI